MFFLHKKYYDYFFKYFVYTLSVFKYPPDGTMSNIGKVYWNISTFFLEQNNILYQQDKNCYLTNIGNIYISKKKDTNFYINSIFILPDSYYYIFYNGCKKYQPQWCFINEYSYLQLNHNYEYNLLYNLLLFLFYY